MNPRSVFTFVLVPLVVWVAGCGGEPLQKRTYQEVVVRPAPPPAANPTPAPAQPGAMSAAQLPASALKPVALAWTVPDAWQEEPAAPPRLGSFRVGGSAGLCTVTSFPGDVGGVLANLQRWAGQLNLPVDEATLQRFAKGGTAVPTQGGWTAQIFDFASLLTGAHADTPSMLAAIVDLGDATVFVKLTGPNELLAGETDSFQAFCSSLGPGGGGA